MSFGLTVTGESKFGAWKLSVNRHKLTNIGCIHTIGNNYSTKWYGVLDKGFKVENFVEHNP